MTDSAAPCSYCGDQDVPTRPLVTSEGLTIFVCEECRAELGHQWALDEGVFE